MRFSFTPEQEALRELARDLFEKESPPSRLRELWNGRERDPNIWTAIARAGLLGIAVPEEHDGSGGSLVDLTPVLEEAGRAALPEPFLETAAIAACVFTKFGDERVQKAEWLYNIAIGSAQVAVLFEDSPFVYDGMKAGLLVERGGRMHLAQSYAPERVESEDRSRDLYKIDAKVGPAFGEGSAAFARRVAAAASACVLNGVSLRLLDMTVAYVKERKQFDRPIGSFQAVKHKLATAWVMLESARASAWYAMLALADGFPDAQLAASVAKAEASEAGAFVNTEALQCHGGIGFTWEHDLHFWLKRGKSLELSYGTAAEHRARIAESIFAAGGADA